MSGGESGWWKGNEYGRLFGRVADFEKRFPHFPDISFDEFVRLSNEAFCELTNRDFSPLESLGLRTEQFVKFYFKNPRRDFGRIDDDYIASEKYRADM